MRCLIVHVTRKRAGAASRRQSVLTKGQLRIGRNTQCEIYLADSRVNFHHARIEESESGYRLIAEGDAQLSLNGAFVESVQLGPGQRIGLGPYLLTVEPPPPDCDLALAFELIRPMGDDLEKLKRRSVLTLEAAGLSRRTGAWLAFVVMLFLVFAVPLASVRLEQVAELAKWAGLTPQNAWQPGETSPAHRLVIAGCTQCHDKASHGVSDEGCTTCHRRTTPHSGDALLHKAGQAAPTCASCHHEHQGPGGLVPADEPACRSCHGDLDRRLPDADLADVSDFEEQHPRFRLPESADSGLKFPHAVHLAGGEPIANDACQACHQPEALGPGMQPLDMTRHCAGCHALNASPDHPDWAVPHATPAEVLAALAHYLSAGNTQELTRLAAPVFEQTCIRCHAVERILDADGPEWRIAPIIQQAWLPAARFDHRRHRTQSCIHCHAVSKSIDSKDVPIPQIATCRECHGGEKADRKLPTACVGCHDYHSLRLKEP